jgi:hypothetical protein
VYFDVKSFIYHLKKEELIMKKNSNKKEDKTNRIIKIYSLLALYGLSVVAANTLMSSAVDYDRCVARQDLTALLNHTLAPVSAFGDSQPGCESEHGDVLAVSLLMMVSVAISMLTSIGFGRVELSEKIASTVKVGQQRVSEMTQNLFSQKKKADSKPLMEGNDPENYGASNA